MKNKIEKKVDNLNIQNIPEEIDETEPMLDVEKYCIDMINELMTITKDSSASDISRIIQKANSVKNMAKYTVLAQKALNEKMKLPYVF